MWSNDSELPFFSAFFDRSSPMAQCTDIVPIGTTSNVRLPPEVLRMIFVNLRPSDALWFVGGKKAQETRSSLGACTLVSHEWHPFARELLFRDVALQTGDCRALRKC